MILSEIALFGAVSRVFRKCGSRVSFADVTDTVVFVADEIIKRHNGDITNRNCVKCTYTGQYPDYEGYDSQAVK